MDLVIASVRGVVGFYFAVWWIILFPLNWGLKMTPTGFGTFGLLESGLGRGETLGDRVSHFEVRDVDLITPLPVNLVVVSV